MPGRLKMRSTGQQHQEGSGGCLVKDQVEQLQGCRISPVQVFQDTEDRLSFGQFQKDRNDGFKCFLALPLR